jgi:hypothetical protein
MDNPDYENELLNIYHKTAGDPENKIKTYNMLNVATVVHGIRKGGIIGSITEETAESIMGSMRRLGLFVKDIRLKEGEEPVLFFARENDRSQRNLLTAIETYLATKNIEPNASDQIINTSFSSKNNFHLNIGKFLGYFNTMTYRNMGLSTKFARIDVRIEYQGVVTTAQLFPQKIENLTESKEQRLKVMATEIGRMPLPEGFHILSSTAVYSKNENASPPAAELNADNVANNRNNNSSEYISNNNREFKGGRHRSSRGKTRHKRVRARTRSSRR